MYQVTFINHNEMTRDSYTYNSLFDAIRVAKETNVGPDRLYTEAIPDELFNEKFFEFMATGVIDCGNGRTVTLFRITEEGKEVPIINTIIPAQVSINA